MRAEEVLGSHTKPSKYCITTHGVGIGDLYLFEVVSLNFGRYWNR